jgi:hypothetical protein
MTIAKLDEQSNRLPSRPSADRPRQTIVTATDVVLLWPHGLAKQAVSNPGPRLWPIFVVVLCDENATTDLSVRKSYDLLGGQCSPGKVTVLAGRCLWSVVPGWDTLLRLAVRASAPVKLEVDVVLPARPLLGAVGWLACGRTVTLTTRRHANRLSTGVNVRNALPGLVLVNCPHSPELAALAKARDKAKVSLARAQQVVLAPLTLAYGFNADSTLATINDIVVGAVISSLSISKINAHRTAKIARKIEGECHVTNEEVVAQ